MHKRLIILFFIGFSSGQIEEPPNIYMEKIFAQFLSVTKLILFVKDNTTIDQNVDYFLYKKSAPEKFIHLHIDDEHLGDCRHIDPKILTTFIVHGWGDHKDRNIIMEMRKAILENIHTNVIVVDWKTLAEQIYFHAAMSALDVGKHLGKFLYDIMKHCGLPGDKIHVIGHSLGAQIAGIAGNIVNGTVDRITGLDPAGPLYEFLYVEGPIVGLNSTSARFVDVIHSAIDDFGVSDPVGHADFYPNSGIIPQPGCTNFFSSGSCSHIRSVKFFVESITAPFSFLSIHCNTTWDWELFETCNKKIKTFMGYHTPKSSKGMFYLRTTSEPPYGLGPYGI